METLPVLYQDEYLIAVNKPSGLLVHRSEIDRHETRFALQILRNQLGQYVYPVHRLDKPTSGVLLMALSSDIARQLSESFAQRQVAKTYHAIVRGYSPEQGYIDHPLKEELDKYTDKKARLNREPQSAQTAFSTLATTEIPVLIETYHQSRYSLVECQPETGRKHQIRRHLKHINHPIIGDAKHGRGRHNRYFKEHFDAGRLLLHASRLQLQHPVTKQLLHVEADFDACFMSLFKRFNWDNPLAHCSQP
ncbi:MAG: tRNA pseudouridine(65) synthase TruC [Candidatus Pelagadaptatus aseana]|uniref:tRNA pseudouridine(65) synthase TruC n=1 Tax=Candidatus Pelagadaptatus aseana TaxID=3120508 RepID=UPI0039B28E49